MNPLYVVTIFENNKPRTTGIKYKDKVKYFDLYRSGSAKPLKHISKSIEQIGTIISNVMENHGILVLNDAKSHYYMLPFIEDHRGSIYEIPCKSEAKHDTFENDCSRIKELFEEFVNTKIMEYQKLLANAAMIYKKFEQNGILSHYSKMESRWSTSTYTGRSKCMGFNVQGAVEEDNIRSFSSVESDYIVTFDWLSADFRIASLLSDDKVLQESFMVSDPYTYLMNVLNADNTEGLLTRDETKLFMLKSINGYSADSQVFEVYQNLGKWVKQTWDVINSGGNVQSILGREFKASEAKTPKSLMNAVMQGSVAHAMHSVLPRLYDVFGDDLITEIHDSIPIMARNNSHSIKTTIRDAIEIVMYPFKGILDDNPVFPVKVSIGKWKKWKPYKTFRGSNG